MGAGGDTGNGKGKSTSAFGMLARSLGHGFQCGVVQFIKGSFTTGEELFFRRLAKPADDSIPRDGRGLHLGNPGPPRDIAAAQAAWQVAARMLADPGAGFVLSTS